MTATISDELSPKTKPNVLRITQQLWEAIQMGNLRDWESFFNEFRLNLQGRIAAASDERELLKLQGKIEEVTEIEQVFIGLLTRQKK
jgi:hypothetical protein